MHFIPAAAASGDFSVGTVFYMLAESVIAAVELNVDASRMDQWRVWFLAIWSLEVASCIAACIACCCCCRIASCCCSGKYKVLSAIARA